MKRTKSVRAKEKAHSTGKYISSDNRYVIHSKGPETGCYSKICVFGKKSIFV